MYVFSFPLDGKEFGFLLLYSFIFGLPAYMCNSFASLSKFLGVWSTPVDFGKKLKDGKRIFGDHKTWRGLFFGILFGAATGVVIWYLCEEKYAIFTSYPWYIGIPMSIGDHVADLFGSFIKRRIGIKSGGAFPPYDQGSWIVLGLVFSFPFIWNEVNLWFYFVTLTIMTPLIHFIVNIVAYWLKLKDVWY